ncbi:NTP transferase domain-containing protein [bacterium]|nr:NTP transferase domain-containing protein [bacterium]
MKVIIPAAGIGSRLRPHTYTVPKVLLPVAGKPIIGHILDQVISWGGKRITIIIGYLGDLVETYVNENYDIDVEFRVQKEALGLGHAVLTGLNDDDGELLVILGDTIVDTDLLPVIEKGITSIGVKSIPDPRKKGVVVVKNGKVTKLIEKPANPPSNLAIVGVYYIRDGSLLGKAIREIMDHGVTVKGEFQITDALQQLIDWGEPFETFPVEGWYDCGRPETLLETNRYLFDNKEVHSGDYRLEQSILIEPVVIGSRSVIERSIIGPYVSVGSGVTIRDSIVRNSIISDDVSLDKGLLEDTIIGKRVEVSGEFRMLNLGASTQIRI